MMEQQRFDVETKRVLLAGLQQSGYSLEEALPEILEELKRLGGPSSSPKLYAKTAAQFILAYLELGFSYLRHRELFDPILALQSFHSSKEKSRPFHVPQMACIPAQFSHHHPGGRGCAPAGIHR